MTAADIELAAGQVWRNARGAELRIGNEARPGARWAMSQSGTLVPMSEQQIRELIRRFGMELVREPNPWNDLGAPRDPSSGGDWTPEKEARA